MRTNKAMPLVRAATYMPSMVTAVTRQANQDYHDGHDDVRTSDLVRS